MRCAYCLIFHTSPPFYWSIVSRSAIEAKHEIRTSQARLNIKRDRILAAVIHIQGSRLEFTGVINFDVVFANTTKNSVSRAVIDTVLA